MPATARRGRGRPPKTEERRAAPDSAGVISLVETYTRRELLRRLGIGQVSIRRAESRGLRSISWGNMKLYRGVDIDTFLQTQIGMEQNNGTD